LAPDAIEWRLAHPDCAIGADVREIVCPDSRKLAEFVDAAMRRKVRERSVPIVRAPAVRTEKVAA
jgi:hypothetical protein